MGHPEVRNQAIAFVNFVDKVRFEYYGNYSDRIQLNPAPLRRLHKIIGMPKKSFVIRDGNETPEGMDAYVTGLRQGYEKPQRKQLYEIRKTDEEIILIIHPQVISGRVQDQQRASGKGNKSILYEDGFAMYMQDVFVKGISDWASGELNKFPVWLKVWKGDQLRRLLEKDKDLFLVIK